MTTGLHKKEKVVPTVLLIPKISVAFLKAFQSTFEFVLIFIYDFIHFDW